VLLKELFTEFDVISPDVDEDAMTCQDPVATAERLARAKAQAVLERAPEALVIAGDTVVTYLDGDAPRQLAKPIDEPDAARMLLLLAGRTHHVVTGLCVATQKAVRCSHDRTAVTFRPLQEAEIWDYIRTGEPMDKAGSYGLQGLGGTFIERIEGSRTNVVGLPMELLRRELIALGALAA
jgi:septum formation protein